MKIDQLVKYRRTCRGCGADDLFCFLNLGKQPLAGAFLKKTEIKNEKKFPLKLYFCKKCKLVQVNCIINPKYLFEKYNYASSNIKQLSDHFKNYALTLKKTYLKKPGSTVLEFGCNDGILLKHFQSDKQINAYGIDPSQNVTKMAIAKGLKIWCDYFNPHSARKILDKIGRVDVVTGSNVFAHTDDIAQIIDAAKLLLKPNGVFIVEVHYLLSLIKDAQYDTFYHEHLSYYSVTALRNIFKINGLKIIDVQKLPQVHGGSIRIVTASENSNLKIKASVDNFIKNESTINLAQLNQFANRVKQHKLQLLQLLDKIKSVGGRIAGYGASGRATILLNYCNIDSKYLDYVVDISPLRAGKLVPGVHIPIVFPDFAHQNPPTYFLVTAWNYCDSIMAQESILVQKGVKFIAPWPRIKIK